MGAVTLFSKGNPTFLLFSQHSTDEGEIILIKKKILLSSMHKVDDSLTFLKDTLPTNYLLKMGPSSSHPSFRIHLENLN